MTPFIENIKAICERISKNASISSYDVFGSIKEDSSASSKEKMPFSLTSSHKNAVILRVWNDKNQIGMTSTSNLTEEGFKLAFEMALNASHFSETQTETFFSPLSHELINYDDENYNLEPVSIQLLSNACVECETLILNSHSAIKSVPYNKVSQANSERFYFNSDQSFRHQKLSTAFCYFYPLAQEENKIPRQLGHFEMVNHFNKLSFIECAKIALEKTIKHLNYIKIPSGQYTLIFSPEAFLDILGAFSNFFNAQNILDKKSLSQAESIGKSFAPHFLNISDCPLNENNIGKLYFDEEGTPTKELNILENGVLKNFIHTSVTAKIFKVTPTGHTSLGSKLTAHTHFIRVFSTQTNSPKLTLDFPYIYVENVKALHAGINALQGSFSLPFDGFFVNAENSSVSIESATVAGDFLTLLQNIVHVSTNEKVTPSGICPEICVKNLSVTGNL